MTLLRELTAHICSFAGCKIKLIVARVEHFVVLRLLGFFVGIAILNLLGRSVLVLEPQIVEVVVRGVIGLRLDLALSAHSRDRRVRLAEHILGLHLGHISHVARHVEALRARWLFLQFVNSIVLEL